MERYNILICQASQRLTVAEGLTLDETIELLTLLNRSRPPRTHYLRCFNRVESVPMDESEKEEITW